MVSRTRKAKIALFFLVGFGAMAAYPQAGSQGSTAVLDLSEHDFSSDGIADLTGDWLIFWETLLEPDDLGGRSLDALAADADGMFSMPHTWNSWELDSQPVGGFGYATFVAELRLPPDMERFALWIPNASTAYALWINDDLVAVNGVVGDDREQSRPQYIVNTVQYAPEQSPVRLTLQVSNFHHRRGGMWRALRLGTPEQIGTLDVQETTYDLLLLGSFLALGLFNLFLFGNARARTSGHGHRFPANPAQMVPLFLALTFFAMSARVIVTGQILATRLFPAFPWSLQLRVEYLSAMVVLALFSLIAGNTYPTVVPKNVVRLVLVFVAVNATIAVLFPPLIYSRIVTSYNIVKSILLLVLTIRFVAWLAQGHREAWPMIGTVIIFFLITFGETLHYREVILSRDFAPVGFIVSLLNRDGVNQPITYLITTLGTLGLILVVFNLFAVRISIAFLNGQHTPVRLDMSALVDQYGVSKREYEVLELVAHGFSNREIGNRLHISEGTVKNHLHRVMRKLDVGSRTEILARFSVQQLES
ncbi:MAG: LuxR C-terminal-related transcriptional regulator [Spirochaetota bacterium]